MTQKDTSVPSGTIEIFGFWSGTPLSDCQHCSIVPFLLRPAVSLRARGSSKSEGGILTTADRPGRIALFKNATQHFVLGYFREVPAGLIFSNHQQRSWFAPRRCACCPLRAPRAVP